MDENSIELNAVESLFLWLKIQPQWPTSIKIVFNIIIKMDLSRNDIVSIFKITFPLDGTQNLKDHVKWTNELHSIYGAKETKIKNRLFFR